MLCGSTQEDGCSLKIRFSKEKRKENSKPCCCHGRWKRSSKGCSSFALKKKWSSHLPPPRPPPHPPPASAPLQSSVLLETGVQPTYSWFFSAQLCFLLVCIFHSLAGILTTFCPTIRVTTAVLRAFRVSPQEDTGRLVFLGIKSQHLLQFSLTEMKKRVRSAQEAALENLWHFIMETVSRGRESERHTSRAPCEQTVLNKASNQENGEHRKALLTHTEIF
jgi:hypothetical protein